MVKGSNNPPIVVDVFQSDKFAESVARFLPVTRMNLVPLGLADIFWIGLDGLRFTIEHKSGEEFLADMGNRLDTQLRKHTQNADDVSLLIEGIVVPGSKGGCYVLHQSGPATLKPVMEYGHSKLPRPKVFNHDYPEVTAYLWSLDKAGITVHIVPGLDAVGQAVASYVFNSLKPEHRTLKRYIKSRPVMWSPNPYKQLLMSVPQGNIGEITADKILGRFKTPWEFFNSILDENMDMSTQWAATMKAIGKKV